MEGKGTVTIGVEYYTQMIEEHAIMMAQIEALKRMIESESYISRKDLAHIFGLELPKEEE